MKLHSDDDSLHRITSYGQGYVTVKGRRLARSLVVTPQTILDWPPETFADLDARHMEPVMELGPEIVVLGTGERQRFPSKDVLAAATNRGIGVEIMDTAAACRTYNVLVGEGRAVAAALLMIR